MALAKTDSRSQTARARARQAMAEMTGLSARDVSAAIRSAKDLEDDTDEAGSEDESESTGSVNEDAEAGTATDSSDSNGAGDN